MIYLKFSGRIGNQIFMYAAARMIQELKGKDEEIIIEDIENVAHDDPNNQYDNSLLCYSLHNTRVVHDKTVWNSEVSFVSRIAWDLFAIIEGKMAIELRHWFEITMQPIFQVFGFFKFENGYIPYPKKFKKNTIVWGYFQSERFFEPIKKEIIDTFSLKNDIRLQEYNNVKEICERNTVCISIKVQHNVGNPMYDVCGNLYYQKAIEKICEFVENPLFFVCSDNVNYVRDKFFSNIDADVIYQEKDVPTNINLAIMAKCKHFIIGNTSYGWWAQYLSENQDKIVIAPSRWYNLDNKWQYDIYMDKWILIEG